MPAAWKVKPKKFKTVKRNGVWVKPGKAGKKPKPKRPAGSSGGWKRRPHFKDPDLNERIRGKSGNFFLAPPITERKPPFSDIINWTAGQYDKHGENAQRYAREQVMPWAQQSLQGLQGLMQTSAPQAQNVAVQQGLGQAMMAAGGGLGGMASNDPNAMATGAQAQAGAANFGLGAQAQGIQQHVDAMRSGAGHQAAIVGMGQDIGRIGTEWDQKKLQFLSEMAPVRERILENRRISAQDRQFEKWSLGQQIKAATAEAGFDREKFNREFEEEQRQFDAGLELDFEEEAGRNARAAAARTASEKKKGKKLSVGQIQNRNKAIAVLDQLKDKKWMSLKKDKDGDIVPGSQKYLTRGQVKSIIMQKYGVSDDFASTLLTRRYKWKPGKPNPSKKSARDLF